MPIAPVIIPVEAASGGFVNTIATRDIGLAVVALGGGRTRPQDSVDHAVGLTGLLPIGAEVRKGEPLGFVHARSMHAAEQASAAIKASYQFSETKHALTDPVIRRIEAKTPIA